MSPVHRFRLYAAFFLSGAAGLIFQVTWARSLALTFGSSVFAVTTVLAAYMAGLGLGSWRLARRWEGHPHPARAYALLEFGVALSGAMTLLVVPLLARVYAAAGGGVFLRIAGSVPLLLIPTFLMGGALPALVRVVRRGENDTGVPVARLYALNTAGAVAGTLAAGFALLPAFGLLRAGLIAASLCLIAGLLAWTVPPTAPSASRGSVLRAPHAAFTAVAALSGATSFMLEVAWTRRLAAPLGGSTYAFAVMLAAFLTGIALGSLLYTWMAQRRPPDRQGLGVVQVATAAAGLVSLALWRGVPPLVFRMLELFGGAIAGVVILQFAAAFLILLLPAILCGVSFPWLAGLLAPEEEGAASGVGRLYAINTLGAIAGALLAGFLLIPLAGAYVTLGVALAGSALAGLLLLGGKARFQAAGALAALGTAAIALRLFALTPADHEAVIPSYFHSALYRSGLTLQEIAAAHDYLFMEDGLNATVAVSRSERHKALRINGKVDASDRDMKTQILLAALPLAHHSHPRRVLVIGYGAGVTTGVAARWPGVEQVDTVEIEPAVLRAAEWFPEWNHDAASDPRRPVILDDARHYLLTTRRRYDVIISEPSNPWMTGVGNLFTAEFYRRARERLNDGGIFVQWVQAYQLLPEDLALISRTMRAAFPVQELWRGESLDFLVLGAAGSWQPAGLAGALQHPYLSRLFKRHLEIREPAALWAYFHLEDADLRRFSGGQEEEINTDDRAALEFRAPWRLMRPADASLPLAVAAARRRRFPQDLTPEQRLVVAETLLRIGAVQESRELARPLLNVIGRQSAIWLYAGELNRALRNPKVAATSYENALARGGGVKAEAGLALLAAETGRPDAEDRLRKVSGKLAPQDDDYFFVVHMLALTLANHGKWEEAIAWQKKAIATGEGYTAMLWTQLGDMNLRKGNSVEAQAAFDQALQLDPYEFNAHRVLGEFYLGANQPQEAAARFRFLLRYHPLRDSALYPRAAEVFERAGHSREARGVRELGQRVFPQGK